ncbi:ion transporter [Deinococcus sonorensis]|uniref:Ion transporter n=2 Tax=Deinococcus sonorensis TaxID=309891 RepID=A0AAU7UDL7_9DEIO
MSHAVDTRAPWRVSLGNIIFNSDTPAGRAFDLLLTVLIIASILVVVLDSVARIHQHYGALLHGAELCFTALFTLEYVARLVTARRASHYARSFFGLVDLLTILPGVVALTLPGAQYLLSVRVLRLLRIFRILKLARYLSEASVLSTALRNSATKIIVFLSVVLTMVTLIGSLMYVVEGPEHGFTSIPTSIYWAIVTLTTVGYGDIAPGTPLGKTLASLAMILGYGVIAVPTGIVTVSLTQAQRARQSFVTCSRCGLQGHEGDARFCRRCAEPLPPEAAADPERR